MQYTESSKLPLEIVNFLNTPLSSNNSFLKKFSVAISGTHCNMH